MVVCNDGPISMTKLGFSGTRSGMNNKQLFVFWDEFANDAYSEFHHGDCVGADADAHKAFRLFAPSTKIVIHPPVDEKLRAFCQGDLIRKPHTHFARNRNIVHESDEMIITPYQNEWQDRGGTWYTHDYALKQKKKVWIIWPDGKLELA